MPATSSASSNPFEAMRAQLVRRLLELVPPKPVRIFPGPTDFDALAEHIKEAAALFDEWLAAVGDQVADNSPYQVDETDFDTKFSDRIADAAYACSRIADRLRDDREAA